MIHEAGIKVLNNPKSHRKKGIPFPIFFQSCLHLGEILLFVLSKSNNLRLTVLSLNQRRKD